MQHTLFCLFIEHSFSRQEIIKITGLDYDKYKNNYKYHSYFLQYKLQNIH